MSINIAIIGHGYVGKAVDHGFSTSQVEKFIIDPLYNNNIEDYTRTRIDAAFVCVPTPFGKSGQIDSSIVEDVVQRLEIFACPIVIKSTVTPDVVDKLSNQNKDVVYNPEFLTEANHLEDFINPNMQILGGELHDCIEVEQAYIHYSKVKIVPTFKTDLTSASLIKYTINSWLATKVSFFNELFHLHQSSHAETSWEQFTDMLKRDPRVGDSHMQVPGPDGQFGFGGHCLPKDTKALLYYSKLEGAPLDLLDEVIKNNTGLQN